MSEVLLETPYWKLEREPAQGLITARRTAAPIDSAGEYESEILKVERAIARLDRSKHVILVDLRLAPMRGDPVFDAMVAKRTPQVLRGFRRVALLIRTAVGALQVQRHTREAGATSSAFQDEAAALAHLLGA